jgi:CRISPR-associated protein Csm2
MAIIDLWKDRDKKLLDPELFSTKAEQLAKSIGDEDKRKNKSTQLRRFFDEINRLNTQAQTDTENLNWNMILPRVHMVVAKTAYAQGRNLVTPSFVNLVKESINQIKEKDDLQVFANFLESFMGFYKVYGPK